jgi:hypothetical protein
MIVEQCVRYAYFVSLLALTVLLLIAIYMCCVTSSNKEPQILGYDFTTLDLPPGSFGTRPLGVNSQGDIVGTNGNRNGFVIRQGSSSTIHVEDWPFEQISAINTSGIMAGTFFDTKQAKPFIYDGQTYTIIDPPAATYNEAPHGGSSHAYGINDLGHVVGSYHDHRGIHGFLYEGAMHRYLDYPQAIETIPTGINAQGHIVGFYRLYPRTRLQGFVFDGKFTTLNYPGGMDSDTQLMGINDADEIVGFCTCGPHKGARGFLYNQGKFIDIQFPNASGTFPNGINSHGMIVGFYNDSEGGHGFYAMRKSKGHGK